jgi:hypothetical protein
MSRSMLVAVMCWAMTSVCLGDEATDAALAEDAGQIDGVGEEQGVGADPDTSARQGVVLELDKSASAKAAGEETAGGFQQRALSDSDVELIIGGQGKDGIAKRSRLKKED